jgi:biopolymer transport protein ExbB
MNAGRRMPLSDEFDRNNCNAIRTGQLTMGALLRTAFMALAILTIGDATARSEDTTPSSPLSINTPAAPAADATSATAPSLSNFTSPAETNAAPASTRASNSQRSDVGIADLPHDMSPWTMFLSADAIVKGVMIGLVFASMTTWTVGLAKGIELLSRRRSLRRTLQNISDASSLADATAHLGRRSNALSALINVATHELHLSMGTVDPQGIKERVQSRLDRIEIAAARDMNRGTGILATIGSTAPFIGLFGTVWGIMNSFVGISQAQTTNLAVVAPGIAEALLATALGLVAAIPAVFIYNQFARALASYKALVGDASADVMRLVSRDLDRGITSRWQTPRAAE